MACCGILMPGCCDPSANQAPALPVTTAAVHLKFLQAQSPNHWADVLQANAWYPEVTVEQYPAEGGVVVSFFGAVTQQASAEAPALLQPFCQAWEDFVTGRGGGCLLLATEDMLGVACCFTCTLRHALLGCFLTAAMFVQHKKSRAGAGRILEPAGLPEVDMLCNDSICMCQIGA